MLQMHIARHSEWEHCHFLLLAFGASLAALHQPVFLWLALPCVLKYRVVSQL